MKFSQVETLKPSETDLQEKQGLGGSRTIAQPGERHLLFVLNKSAKGNEKDLRDSKQYLPVAVRNWEISFLIFVLPTPSLNYF